MGRDLEPALTWIDLTSRDRDQMRRVIDLLSEQGTVDEMGLGTIRDAFADALFPGTSSIQTRLRYVLFIPWIYRQLESKRRSGAEIEREAREAELALVGPLKKSGDTEGVIGARAGAELSRLPSDVYWAGLVRWGIFQHPQSQSWYHTHFESLARASGEIGRADDPGVVWERKPVWHPRLPAPPADFPAVASFALTPAESDFIRGRFEETCRGTLLAWLARSGSGHLTDVFWEDPAVLAAGAVAEDSAIAHLVRARELKLKGARARFTNHNRLLDWSGGVGLGPLTYRWFRVRQLLIDLHRGFAG